MLVVKIFLKFSALVIICGLLLQVVEPESTFGLMITFAFILSSFWVVKNEIKKSKNIH